MNKKYSFGPDTSKYDSITDSLTSCQPLKLEDIKKASLSIFGTKVISNKYLPKGYAVFVNSKGDIEHIIKVSNRKVIFKLWRFELAYYKKENVE